MSTVIRHGAIRRGRRTVLAQSSLSLPRSGTVGIIGANGSGKSTLFLALAGALRAGRATVERGETGQASPGSSLFLMPQTPALPGWMTGERIASLYGQDLAALTLACPRFRLEELAGTLAARMSGGQRQALVLALALGSGAQVVLLDEPLAHLDLPRRHAAIQVLAEARTAAADRLTLVSSQSVADVADVCDWYVVLREGRYAFNGSVEELLGESWRSDPARLVRLEERLLALSGFAL